MTTWNQDSDSSLQALSVTLTEAYGNPITIMEPPKYVGGYRMGCVVFMLVKKPSVWHRFWVRVTLGWKWEDEK